MRVSIIVPARNEARRIVTTLAALQSPRAAGHEVIVVDGGSTDATLALASPLADRAFVAASGRATQMNAGAAAASGDVLLFLHADSRLPEAGVPAIVQGLARSGRRWGRFDVTIAGASRVLAIVAAMMNARSRITGIATGDQGIFVARTLFEAVGGYPDQPLMEDIALSRRLNHADGSPLCLQDRIVTSGRRWAREGPWRTILAMWQIRFAYWRGVSPARLADRYEKMAAVPKVTLQIFAKDPLPGYVKTRLAAAVGAEEAVAYYVRLVEKTLATAAAARVSGVVDRVELWGAPDIAAPAFTAWGARFGVALKAQTGDDLGAKMRHAMYSALEEGSCALLVGTDCPALDVAYLAQAAAALDEHDVVFGPAEDGGYVLIGLRRAIDAFSGVPWSSVDTMAATRATLHAQHVRWHELRALWDIDSPADLARWRAMTAAV